MTLKIYQIDAFAKHIFEGNPAAICFLKLFLPSFRYNPFLKTKF